jgi:hypothetical protein
MNTFNKKSLFVALASLGALSVTGTADAVYVNPDGTGQVLLYPYYTVRDKVAGTIAPFNSLLSVVNSTISAKIVKVRFLEGKNSRKCLTSTCSCRGTTCGRRRSSTTARVVPCSQATRPASCRRSFPRPATRS